MAVIDINIVEVREGYTPVYKHEIDALADCRANIKGTRTIAPRGMITVPLGFKIDIPVGWEGRIESRSGLARNNGVIAVDGHIDPGFVGEVTATLINLLDAPFIIHDGDRICQLKVAESRKICFHKVDSLPESERSENGWGSTGLK